MYVVDDDVFIVEIMFKPSEFYFIKNFRIGGVINYKNWGINGSCHDLLIYTPNVVNK